MAAGKMPAESDHMPDQRAHCAVPTDSNYVKIVIYWGTVPVQK
jgi:hypothetical protein